MTDTSPERFDELLPLSPPVYHVLLALGRDVLHGYAIMQTFAELSDGQDEILPGTLYATLARMVETGLIEAAEPPEEEGDARRRYYRATGRGRSLAAAESERIGRMLRIAEARRIVPEST